MAPSTRSDDALAHAIAGIRQRVAEGPPLSAPSPYGRPVHALRRAVHRLIRNQRLHQDALTVAVLDVVEQLAARADEAESRQRDAQDRLATADRRLAAVEARAAYAVRRATALEALLAARTAAADGRPDGRGPAVDHDAVVATLRARVAADLRDPSHVAGLHDALASEEVETDVGVLLLPATDKVMLPAMRSTGRWEPDVAALLRRTVRRGATVLNIGAHVGYHTLLSARAAGPCGRVIAFEPEPLNGLLLEANVARNGLRNVTVLHAAVSDTTGPVSLSIARDNSGDHRVGGPRDRTTISVPGVAVDDLLPQDAAVDVVLVDLQGMDHLALTGMAGTLQRCAPTVLCEFWPSAIRERGEDPAAVLAGYRDMGFDVSALGEDRPAKLEDLVHRAQARPTGDLTLVLAPAR